MKINKIRILSLIACFSMSVAMAGCQESPEESVVVNKDMDNLIEEATKEDDEGFDLEEDAGKYNTYKKEINNEALGVHVSVDAKVDIPQTDKLSMYRVEVEPISQELMDALRRELIGDETLYEGKKLDKPLKCELEEKIAYYVEEINNIKWDGSNGSYTSKEAAMEVKEMLQKELDEFRKKYETAPEELVFSKEDIYDGKIKKISQLYKEDTELYHSENMMNPKGEMYYGVTDGSNGYYSLLYAHTSPTYSNVIRYRKCAYGYLDEGGQTSSIYKYDRGLGRDIDKSLSVINTNKEFTPVIVDEKTTISKDEAIELADEFLKKVGLEEFKCYEGDIYTEHVHFEKISPIDEKKEMSFRTYYILTYMRTVDGVFVNPNDGVKRLDVSYITEWPVEEIEILINDSGIVGFEYVAPLTLTEVVVDDTHMKTYEDIIKTFEDMIAIKHAVESEDEKREITVDRVALSYARICEEDSLTKGLLVPVWDFQGKSKLIKHGNSYTTNDVMTINAIDGTVIDRSLGY